MLGVAKDPKRHKFINEAIYLERALIEHTSCKGVSSRFLLFDARNVSVSFNSSSPSTLASLKLKLAKLSRLAENFLPNILALSGADVVVSSMILDEVTSVGKEVFCCIFIKDSPNLLLLSTDFLDLQVFLRLIVARLSSRLLDLRLVSWGRKHEMNNSQTNDLKSKKVCYPGIALSQKSRRKKSENRSS